MSKVSKIEIPAHILEAFPRLFWPAHLQGATESALKHELLYLVLTTENQEDLAGLMKSLSQHPAQLQIDYLRSISETIAEIAKKIPLPKHTAKWLYDVHSAAWRLEQLLLSGAKRATEKEKLKWSKKQLPLNWLSPAELMKSALRRKKLMSEKVSSAFKQLHWAGISGRAGMVDTPAILAELKHEAKGLESSPAFSYARTPRALFSLIASDKTLYLSFKREAVAAMLEVNLAHFGEHSDTLTARILSCVFNLEISNNDVQKIRIKLSPTLPKT